LKVSIRYSGNLRPSADLVPPHPGAPNLSADYLSFARSKGAFIGISLEGAVIAARGEYNKTSYGKPVRPVDILVKGDVSNPKAAKLREALAEAAR
jgi:SH3 domain-containing YSC84-like protein 1